MNQLSTEKRVQIIKALVEGCSIRAIVRMTGCSKNTIGKLILDLGTACSDYMDRSLVNLTCKRVQCDEIWSFVAAKQKNVTPELLEKNPHAGDVWTWIAMDADTKLVCSWMIGKRDTYTGRLFVQDLARRMANRIQLTTDGNKLYLHAVAESFGEDVDYGILVKHYGNDPAKYNDNGPQRYSPPECLSCEKKVGIGEPDAKHISTSYIERQNLTLRMSMRRFTRLTNAFSKKIESHACSLAIHYAWYNYIRIHQTLRVTPAMAAGVTDRLWDFDDLIGLLD